LSQAQKMKKRAIRLPAPYLRRVWLDESLVADAEER
jgi:hypothetical protein